MIKIMPDTTEIRSEKTESQKVSYWLEKLFKQRKRKDEDEKRGKLAVERSSSQSNVFADDDETTIQSQTEQSIADSGREDAVKRHFRKIGVDKHRLDDMLTQSNRIIISASSMFPWDIFPNTINVEETRVTIIHRQLFASQVHSVDIKNISNVFIDTDLFFAAITIVSSTFEENNIKIMKLRRGQAILVRRVIEGLRMFIERDIDTSKYSTTELINKLKELSTTKTVF